MKIVLNHSILNAAAACSCLDSIIILIENLSPTFRMVVLIFNVSEINNQ